MWVESLRLSSLPLSMMSVITGLALATDVTDFKITIAALSLLTAALLQILSNLANDYGDVIKGADATACIAPQRGIHQGIITFTQMKKALIIITGLTIASGLSLIIVACENPKSFISFLLLGLIAIVAAITYTIGKKPYGYIGLGDISVLFFFGWLSVGGTFYLQTGLLDTLILLPATACGLMAVAVLNINNLRDVDNDRQYGKNTLAVRLGPRYGRYYHLCILASIQLCLILFCLLKSYQGLQWLFLLSVPLFYLHGRLVLFSQDSAELCPLLEQMIKLALLVNLLFSISFLLR